MSNNTVREGKRWIALNTSNGAVHVVIANSYWKAFKQARAWFGKAPLHIAADTLSTR